MTAPRRPIEVLSPLVAGQIAAGEVVERPASVVKELVENALDAGASRIEVRLSQGGTELVGVSDDGGGIPRDELALALAPHATSKVRAASDLDRIATLGFRGEALASIASVARVTLRSRVPGEPDAWIVEAENGRVTDPRPAAGPPGTSVEVRSLFHNTPARRKFLRTVPTEHGRCIDVVGDLAMAHPAAAFRVLVESDSGAPARAALDLPSGQGPRERAVAILGTELAPMLIDAGADAMDDARGIALWGLAGTPELARGTSKAQHVFINGRAIRDRTIQHAIAEAYRGLIEPGRYPTVVLMLEMSPEGVDVNVHPAKAEVRFRDSSLVHSVVLGALRRALATRDLTPHAAGALNHAGQAAAAGRGGPGAADATSRFVDYFTRVAPAAARLEYDAAREVLGGASPAMPAPPAPRHDGPPIPVVRPALPVMQVHKSYLVTQDEQGMLIVDQHALHERVMFERLIERVERAGLERQRLLAPAIVDASPTQIERLPDLAPLLDRIGVEAGALGPGTIGVHAFPTMLMERGVDPSEFMGDLLDRVEAEGFVPTSEGALHEVLDMMACKAAVKAGDALSEGELSDLLSQREAVERSSNCPHGRPTSIRVTIRDLERLFGRS